MRILLIAPHAFYIDRGSPIDVDLLARALCRRGVTVDLVVYAEGEDRSYPGLTIHRANSPRWLRGVRPGFSLRKLAADFWLFLKVWQLLRTHRYDLIHAGEETVYFALVARRLMKVPYVYDMDSSLAQQIVESRPYLKPLSPLFSWFERRAICGAVAVAPVCNALADLAHQHGAKHVTTLHDISQLPSLLPPPKELIRERLSITGTLLMYVGNLEPYQGIDLLLEAMPHAVSEHPDLALVIAGGTPSSIEHYRLKTAGLGIGFRVHFIGPWPAERLGELLVQADILTAPRIKGINTPMKVFPYLHTGRAVLVTDLPTHTQILHSGICELAAPEPRAFAAGIVRLAADPGRRNELGQAGRAFVEANHTFEAHERRVNALYDDVQSRLPHVTSAAVPADTFSN